MPKDLIPLWRKRRKTLGPFHTQEVTGSSPVVSTKEFLISQEIRNFSFLLCEIIGRFCGRFPPTQAVTHTGKEQRETDSTGQEFPCPVLLFCEFYWRFCAFSA